LATASGCLLILQRRGLTCAQWHPEGQQGFIGGNCGRLLVLWMPSDDIIIIETVGVGGQDEAFYRGPCRYDLLVEVPGMGDDGAGLKAGVLESPMYW